MPLYLTEADVAALLTPAAAVDVIESCFRRMAAGVVEIAPRRRLRLPEGALADMAAADGELGLAGGKLYAATSSGTTFVVCLFDSDSSALVAAVGANVVTRRELDNTVLERAQFVCCDWLEQARLESGDLVEPIQAGVLDWLEVHELHEVLAGEIAGRQSEDDIVVFKSNGLAAWDVAIGAEALRLAREQGVGTDL